MSKKSLNDYRILGKHYESILKKFGDSNRGMDWKNDTDSLLRFKIIEELFEDKLNLKNTKIKLLDFGCGTSNFFEYLKKKNNHKHFNYTGIDINYNSIEISKNKFPSNSYLHKDILNEKVCLDVYDYIIINGLFTQKLSLSFKKMTEFMFNILNKLSNNFSIAMSFNVLSENVDYFNKKNYYPKARQLEEFICKNITRNFVIRHDYGLYEKTFYLYKDLYK